MVYFILRSDKAWSLSNEVVKDGSKPQGGVSVHYDYRTGEVEYVQAMVHDDGV